MSVVLRLVLEASGRRVVDMAQGMAVAEIDIATCVALGLEVEPDPLPDEPAHAHVVGVKTKSVRRKLASAARWAVPPLPTSE